MGIFAFEKDPARIEWSLPKSSIFVYDIVMCVYGLGHICDMIKGNELGITEIVFEKLAKKKVHFCVFYIVFSTCKLLNSSATRHPILMEFIKM